MTVAMAGMTVDQAYLSGPCTPTDPCGYRREGTCCTFCWRADYHADESLERVIPDPFNLTKYDRTRTELEMLLLFSLIVAGKRADFATKKLDLLVRFAPDIIPTQPSHAVYYLQGDRGACPFEQMRYLATTGRLTWALKAAGTGQYVKLVKAITYLTAHPNGPHFPLDLQRCSVSELEAVPGVGPKTARMFVLHSRPNQRLAVLDVHVLRYLGSLPYKVRYRFKCDTVPRSTPPGGPTYRALEELFLHQADALGMTPADLDLDVWKRFTISKASK